MPKFSLLKYHSFFFSEIASGLPVYGYHELSVKELVEKSIPIWISHLSGRTSCGIAILLSSLFRLFAS